MSARVSAAERAALPVARAALESQASGYGVSDAIVFALGSAGLLMSPETAAELARLRTRAAALDARLSEPQRAALLAQLGDAKPATDGLLVEYAQQIRDRREHDHDSAGPDWDWYCLNASGWLGDKAPTVMRRLVDAEAEVDRLRAERHSTNEALDSAVKAIAAAGARITELEQQLAAVTRRDITSPLRTILRHGDMSEQVRREIGDLLTDTEDSEPAAVSKGCAHVREGGCCSNPGYCCHGCTPAGGVL